MKILLVTILTLFALTTSAVDTTTIVRIYEVDGYELIDYMQDDNLYVGVYYEDLMLDK